MKVSNLTAGKQLDSLVAMAREWERYGIDQWKIPSLDEAPVGTIRQPNLVADYQPSTNGAQAFELIEEFNILLVPLADEGRYTGEWEANIGESYNSSWGYSPAEAICKAVCAAKWGDEIPDSIMIQIGY